jgi:hypothetical protein
MLKQLPAKRAMALLPRNTLLLLLLLYQLTGCTAIHLVEDQNNLIPSSNL